MAAYVFKLELYRARVESGKTYQSKDSSFIEKRSKTVPNSGSTSFQPISLPADLVCYRTRPSLLALPNGDPALSFYWESSRSVIK